MPPWYNKVIFFILLINGGLESRCVGRVYGADVARHHPHRTHDPRSGSQDHHYPKTRCRKPYVQLNIWRSWWWAYVPETCRAKNTSIKSIKLPYCVKLAFHIILWGICTVKRPSRFAVLHWEMSLINGCIPVQYCPHRVHIGVQTFWCLSHHLIDLQHVAAVMSCYVCCANT